MKNKAINIILIEDNPEYRRALTIGVERMKELSLVAQFGNAEQALRALQADVELASADVLLLDLNLPKLSGLDAIEWIQTYVPNLKVLILTQSYDEQDVLTAIERGASGYLLKSSTMKQIRDAVIQVMDGEAPIDPKVTSHMIKGLQKVRSTHQPEVQLTERELEILALLSKGKIKKEIAQELTISEHTVITHVRHIYEKFEVINAPSAISKAYEMGVLPMK